MLQITKDKNILTLTIPATHSKAKRTYYLDINTGVLTGVRGIPLKNTPSGLFNDIPYHRDEYIEFRAILLALHYIIHRCGGGLMADALVRLQQKAEWLQMADRYAAVGIWFKQWNTIGSERFVKCVNLIPQLSAWHKENPSENQSLEDYLRVYEKTLFRQQWKLDEVHYPDHEISYLMSLYERLESQHTERFFPRCLYYLGRGVYETARLGECERTMKNLLAQLVEAADKLQLEELPKGDFLRAYVQVVGTWETERDRIENERMVAFQTSREKALSFEYGDYKVIIPTLKSQFKEEAEMQDNCVFRLYLPRVLENRTHIVFIRHKDKPTKSVVTCEVSTDGDIVQFLLRHNNWVSQNQHPDLWAFQQAYQTHIKNNW